jgi:hypothetical protein
VSLVCLAAAAEQVQQIGAEEGHRHRAQHHEADHAQVDRALAQVHGGAERPHEHGGDKVAGDRRRRRDAEDQDQHRGHQRPAARAGEADEQADHGAAENHVGIQVHVVRSSKSSWSPCAGWVADYLSF